jgi:hypothetical protein
MSGERAALSAWYAIGGEGDAVRGMDEWEIPEVGNPEVVDRYQDKLLLALNRILAGISTAGISDYADCRFSGFINGTLDKAYLISFYLIQTCVLDGEFWGDFMGTVYCADSIAFDGLVELGLIPRDPVGLCGAHFQWACERVFEETTEAYAGCDPYDDDSSYADVWEEFQYNECSY